MPYPTLPNPGTVVPSGSLITPSGTMGAQGPTGPTGPTGVSADSGNMAVLGSDNLISVPSSSIWGMRLRSFNVVQNSTFEVDQRNVGNGVANPAAGVYIQDRWRKLGGGTYQINGTQGLGGAGLIVPGTNFRISSKLLSCILTTQQTTLAATDYLSINQVIEGVQLRELIGDVHSLSLLVYTGVAGLKFSVGLRDASTSYSLVNLCTIPTVNTWTLIQLPNLPVWTPSGTFNLTPGTIGCYLDVCLAAGSTYIAPAAGSWQSGNFLGAPGISNFCASPVNSYLYLAFVQHEPGSVCTMPIDKPFTQNYDECLRYYCKSYDYDVAVGTANAVGDLAFTAAAATSWLGYPRYPKSMAKIPTVTPYSQTTGAANMLRSSGADYALSAMQLVGKSGFQGLTTTTGPTFALGLTGYIHYTADTGW